MIQKYGIDFGTTNSSIAVRSPDDEGKEWTTVVTLKDTYPEETIPSTVCICEDGNVFVGEQAYTEFAERRANGQKVRLIKRIKMDLEEKGRGFSYQIGEKTFQGVDLIAHILQYLRSCAEKELEAQGITASGVVLGVPVQYGDVQKAVLKEALIKAGFYSSQKEAEEQTEFVSEPVAVAVHYGLKVTDNKTVLVFDFGGGTLDLAIVNLKEQVGTDHLHPHEVKAKKRLTLGGEALTKMFFVNTFCGENGYGTQKICKAFGFKKNLTPEELWKKLSEHNIGVELLEEVEHCKCALSKSKTYDFSFLGPWKIELKAKKIWRDFFEEAIADAVQNIDDLIDECLKAAEIEDYNEIDHVIIAGGSSLIPCIKDRLVEKFGSLKVATKPGKKSRFSTKPKDGFSEKEILTSIVHGLAAVGCRKEALVDDIVDNDYGIWLDIQKRFEPIVQSGMKVKEASHFDQLTQEGLSRELVTEYKTQKDVTIKVYQRNLNGEQQLGSIVLNDVGSQKYRIFMYIDAKKGMLVVELYDKGKGIWYDIPLEQKQYRIKNKGR